MEHMSRLHAVGLAPTTQEAASGVRWHWPGCSKPSLRPTLHRKLAKTQSTSYFTTATWRGHQEYPHSSTGHHAHLTQTAPAFSSHLKHGDIWLIMEAIVWACAICSAQLTIESAVLWITRDIGVLHPNSSEMTQQRSPQALPALTSSPSLAPRWQERYIMTTAVMHVHITGHGVRWWGPASMRRSTAMTHTRSP